MHTIFLVSNDNVSQLVNKRKCMRSGGGGGGGGGVCVCVCVCVSPNEKPKSVADPGFPRGSTDIKWRHQPIIKEYRTTVMRPNFPENCMEMRLIGGACLKFVYH